MATQKITTFPGRTRLRKGGFLPGRNVKITNPKAAPTAQARRTPSLGMGGIDQYNKT